MDIEGINAAEEEDKNSGTKRRARYVLAERVTRTVHGEGGWSRRNGSLNVCSAVRAERAERS